MEEDMGSTQLQDPKQEIPIKTSHQEAMEVAEEAREKEYRHPSFGGQLFMGTFDWKLLFPFPEQDLEDKKRGDEFIANLTGLLKNQLDPEKVDAIHEIPKEVIQEMGRLGVF